MTKLVTRNDLILVTVIAVIVYVIWFWIEYSHKKLDPYASCKIGPWELLLSDDQKNIKLKLEDGRTFSTEINHVIYEGTQECTTLTYIFDFNNQTIGLSNLGCFPSKEYPDNVKGWVHIGNWDGGDPELFDWTNTLAIPPSDGGFCF